MIVASRFDGDDNQELMLAQHDVYGASLNIIVQECLHIRQQSLAVLKIDNDPLFKENVWDVTYDHRNLQDAHDHLAAYWRRRSGLSMPQLPFEGSLSKDIGAWQGWLLNEVRSWFYSNPNLILIVTRILAAQQNQKIAQSLEALLLDVLQKTYDLAEEDTT